jgi:hypothetical protein
MIKANVPLAIQYRNFLEEFKRATLLDGLVSIEVNEVTTITRYIHWWGMNPESVKHLRVWGKAETVTVKLKMTPKVTDCGAQCSHMFVGYMKKWIYALVHPGDILLHVESQDW